MGRARKSRVLLYKNFRIHMRIAQRSFSPTRVTAGRRLSALPLFSAVQLLCNGYFSTKEELFEYEEVFDYLDNEAFILIGNLSSGC